MAEQVAGAIKNARRYQTAQNRIQELSRILDQERTAFEETQSRAQELRERLQRSGADFSALRQREERAREARNALEIKLVSSRAEAEGLAKRLAVLETDLAQAHANSEAQLRWYEEELARRQTVWQDAGQTSEWTQVVLQGMTAGLIITDADGVVQEANVAAEILLERAQTGLNGLDLAAVSDDDRWQQAVDMVKAGEAVRLMTQVGSRNLLCDLAPLSTLDTGQDEQLEGWVVVVQDVSTEAEEQRVQLETLASMADELRTPMTTISNYVDLLLSGAVGELQEAQRKFLLRVKAGTGRMAQMAEDLAQEASGEEQWTSPQRQTVNVSRLIEGVVAGSHVQLEDKSLSLDLELPEDLPTIKADPDYLRRVLSNLLSNAYLASSEGGRIQVWATQSNGPAPQQEHLELNGDGFVIVSVKDFGGGLPDEALERVFDRARPSQTPAGLGESGAGLALVKTLVEAHGGRLWVESEQGVGTTFRFVLPISVQEGFPVVGRTLPQYSRASTG
jgi:two-component system phosphate regulon sensor histidine kinase PhoR